MSAEGAKVAVFPMKNNGQAQHAGLSSGIAAMLNTNLNRSEALDVVEPQAVFASISKHRLTGGAPRVDEALKAAAELGAKFAVTGEFVVFGGRFRVDARVYDVEAGTLKSAESVQGREDAFFELVDELSGKVVVSLVGALPKPKGTLEVVSRPEGAAVWLDDEEAGETPLAPVKVSPGRHAVRVELAGYKPFTAEVAVPEGGAALVEAALEPLYGGIRVWWYEYPTSDVSLGDEIISTAQFRHDLFSRFCKNLPAGTYRVSARMPYKDETSWDNARTYNTYTAEVEVRPGEVTDIFINNRLFSPSVEVSACASCAGRWDFDTRITWYESTR